MHSGPTPKALFQCEFCEKEYLHSNNYFHHRKKVHPKEYARLKHDREQQLQSPEISEGKLACTSIGEGVCLK